MDKRTAFHYMDLMGIQSWQLKNTSPISNQIQIYRLLNNQYWVGLLAVTCENQEISIKKQNLINAIFASFNLMVEDYSDDFSPQPAIDGFFLITMGENAKTYAQQYPVKEIQDITNRIETIDVNEVLRDAYKKKIVWENLKIIAKLIKTHN